MTRPSDLSALSVSFCFPGNKQIASLNLGKRRGWLSIEIFTMVPLRASATAVSGTLSPLPSLRMYMGGLFGKSLICH